MSKYFPEIKELPPDPLFGLKARYTSDSRSDKVDLGIGAYRDNNGKPWILPAVKKAEVKLINDPSYNHEYLAIEGFKDFVVNAANIILGGDSVAINENRLISQQSLSGTGALHLCGKFLKEFYHNKSAKIYLSKPTWANHNQIFQTLGYETDTYPYWDKDNKALDLKGFLEAIDAAPKGSIFLLHSCAHNPTGLDPSKEEWLQIIDKLAQNDHLPLFDSAYQGFASGDLELDSFSIRTAVNSKKFSAPIVICQSFAKNCGMYGERVGAVHVIPSESNEDLNKAITSQLKKIIRSEISNPPAYGAKIVAKILQDPELYGQWKQDLITMSSRIKEMRVKLRDQLVELQTPGTWDHIVNQSGMFSFTGLTPDMVKRLEEKHAIYLVASGRASVAGLNDHNIKKVAVAMDEVVRFYSKSKL